MSNLAKFDPSFQDVRFVDDLKQPVIGKVVKNTTILGGAYVSGIVGSLIYLNVLGLIPALALAYLGIRDIKATIDEEESEAEPAYAEAESEPTPSKQLPSAPAPPPGQPGSPYTVNPWGPPAGPKPLPPSAPQSSHYGQEVYLDPDDRRTQLLTAQQPSQEALAASRAPDVDLMRQMPLKERAAAMLDKLALAGCDLWAYVADSILVGTGTQQSGKSTLVMVIAILEAALYGKKIYYVTSDSDIYPVKFAGVADGDEYYSPAADAIRALKKDKAGDQIWILDEISKQPGPVVNAVWEALLTGFVKTRASARLITHGTTMSAMGFPLGWSEQVKAEATILKAHRKADLVRRKEAARMAHGGGYPSGLYRLQELQKDGLQDSDSEPEIRLPDWLQFDKNDAGHPCYVRSLLQYFPELDRRVCRSVLPELFPGTGQAEPAAQAKPDPGVVSQLNALLEVDAPESYEPVDPEADANLIANAQHLADIAKEHMTEKGLPYVSLARLLADNYQVKKALRMNSTQADIREKGRETAKKLIRVAGGQGFVKLEERGDTINIFKPEATLFS